MDKEEGEPAESLAEAKIRSIVKDVLKEGLDGKCSCVWNFYTDGLDKFIFKTGSPIYEAVKAEFGDKADIDWDDMNAVKEFWKNKYTELVLPGLKEEGFPDNENGDINFTIRGYLPNNDEPHIIDDSEIAWFEEVLTNIAKEYNSKACKITGDCLVESAYYDVCDSGNWEAC